MSAAALPPRPSFSLSKMFGEITHRDVICLSFAIAIHSLLFLWKGGAMLLPESQLPAVGDMIVEVRFMNEVPDYGAPPAGGSSKPQGFLARMKSIMKGEGGSGPKEEQLAMGQADKIEIAKPAWNKADPLQSKTFTDKKGFEGLTAKQDALDVAMGKANEIVVKPSQGNFKAAEPNLKESAFKVAVKDAPFTIVKPKTSDSLSNVNAVPVVVGRTTSASVKSLDGGRGAGPALQSKTFASAGGKTFGGGGTFGSSSGGDKSGAGGGLATGAAMASAAIPAGSGAGTGIGTGTGNGVGSGAGSASGRGSGYGSGSGAGVGNGNGGRTWGGSGGGVGSNPLRALPRNRVTDDVPSASAAASRSGLGFNITGALANRPILNKVLPPYERDARVALRFRVDFAGRVLDGIIIEISSGSPSFDKKVAASLKEWQFTRLPANRTNEIQEGVITFVFKGV